MFQKTVQHLRYKSYKSYIFKQISVGFGVADAQDDVITEEKLQRKLVCGTSKKKQKSKNLKTAGW